jgi:hypothetical protein
MTRSSKTFLERYGRPDELIFLTPVVSGRCSRPALPFFE